MKTFKKILIANRGEIAVRVIRTARNMGIRTVAIFTETDRHSLHVSQADEAVLLLGKTLQESYLNQQQIIHIALGRKADAIHPGYGFLAENAGFAEAVRNAGLTFIGPTPQQIRLMSEKNKALELARELDIPVLNSVRGNKNELLRKAKQLGFPLMVKAVAGGGGKGMLTVHSKAKLEQALEKAERQAFEYFGNGDLFIEEYMPETRHIEVQLLGDHHGNLVHLFERECSIQRRFQKIVEEAPSVFIDEELRKKLYSAALKIGEKVRYRGLGTVEFLVDKNGNFWFLEMNTRIQVEHPVTEVVTGIDLVGQQLLVAAGNKLEIKQKDVTINGHAIEARVCAEDAERKFRPSTGKVKKCWFPETDGLRTDHFLQSNTQISPLYDSLLAKQIARASSRQQAIDLLSKGLQATFADGVKTNIPFLLQLLNDPHFRKNEISTSFLNDFALEKGQSLVPVAAAYLFSHLFRKKAEPEDIWQYIGFLRQNMSFRIWIDENEFELNMRHVPKGIQLTFEDETYIFRIESQTNNRLILESGNNRKVFFLQDKKYEMQIYYSGRMFSVRSNLVKEQVRIERQVMKKQTHFQEQVVSDLFGRVLSAHVKAGERVLEGKVLLLLESMKTEFRILCPQNSVIKKVWVNEGEMIKDGQLLVELAEENLSEQSQFSVTSDENFP